MCSEIDYLGKYKQASKHNSHTSLSLQNVAPNETSRTPVTKVGRDNEKVGRVCQVFAQQFPIFVLLVFTQSAHKDGDDTKVVFTTAKSDQLVLPCRKNSKQCGVVGQYCCHLPRTNR